MFFAKEISVDAAIVAISSELDSIFTLEEKEKISTKVKRIVSLHSREFVARNNLMCLGVLLGSAGKFCLLDVCYKNKVKRTCTKRISGTLVWSRTNMQFLRKFF